MTQAVVASSAALDQLCVNTVRTLAIDAVQQANSGHPGAPMGLAPLCYVLWTKHLRHNPADPAWFGRDRFVLSCGHASMLLYGLLHLSGYDLPLDEIRNFRQWGSRTPGHPEFGLTPGAETTTGPLGQGMGNAVGMAIARAHLAARFDQPDLPVLDHRVFFLASDGDLMEGISHEAASLAGHLGLGHLIGFYDDNGITIDGPTALAYGDDVAARFGAYGWHVTTVDDGNDLAALDRAIAEACEENSRPSLVMVRTRIGYGSPNKEGTAAAHGAPLGADEVRRTKERLGWPGEEPFHIPEAALAEWRACRERGAAWQRAWEDRLAAYRERHPDAARELTRRIAGRLPEGWEGALPSFPPETPPTATRAASGTVLNALAPVLPELLGGSADLGGSTNTLIDGADDLGPGALGGRNMYFGIREHGMAAAMNGMALHGGVLPYGGTFLVFSDYMRPSIRLAAMMELHVIYVFTHDSIGLGEDGPTHQPVEQLSALRTIPNLTLFRPADPAETAEAWRAAVTHRGGPVALVLTRQKVPTLDRERLAGAEGLHRGAYVLTSGEGSAPQVILMASGSEVGVALAAQEALQADGVAARVVSMPSHECFARQPRAYRDEVLPPDTPWRVAVEAGQPLSWDRWVGDRGVVVGIDRFGASAPYERLYREFGITAEAVAAAARKLLAR